MGSGAPVPALLLNAFLAALMTASLAASASAATSSISVSVSSLGDDSSPAGPFLTLERAFDYLSSAELHGANCSVTLSPGRYSVTSALQVPSACSTFALRRDDGRTDRSDTTVVCDCPGDTACGLQAFGTDALVLAGVNITGCAPALLALDVRDVRVDAVVFAANEWRSGGVGSAVHVVGGALVLNDSAFSGNYAPDSCGAVYAERAEVAVRSVRFEGNAAANDGGALCVVASASLSLAYVSFMGNSAGSHAASTTALHGAASTAGKGRGTGTGGSRALLGKREGSSLGGSKQSRYVRYVEEALGAAWGRVFTGGRAPSGKGSLRGSVIVGGDAAGLGRGGGLFVYNVTKVVVAGCSFDGNTAVDGGAAYLNTTVHAELTGSTARENSAGGSGGGVWVGTSSSLRVESFTLTNNTASRGGSLVVLAVREALLCNVTVSESTARNSGGVEVEDVEEMVIHGGELAGNQAPGSDGSDGYGGALRASRVKALTLNGTSFSGNVATYGGAVYLEGVDVATATRTEFRGNSADSGGAVCMVLSNTTLLASCNLSSNTASLGGAVFASAVGTLRVELGTSMLGNVATGHGGAVYVSTAAEVAMVGSTLAGNRATDGEGGAARLYNVTSVQCLASAFLSNVATDGGALHLTFVDVATATDSVFDSNSASQSGGAVCWAESTAAVQSERLALRTCAFTSSFASWGGAVWAAGLATLHVLGGSFGSNVASASGGAMYLLRNTHVIVENATFTSNYAVTERGGGIAALSVDTLSVSGCSFASHWANLQGGAVYASAGTNATFTNTTMSGNVAQLNGGGGTSIRSFALLTLTACNLTSNDGGKAGGSLYTYSVKAVSLWDSLVRSSTAAGDGGGAYIVWADAVEMENTTFVGNAAPGGKGGGVYMFVVKAVRLASTAFFANSANDGGGACLDLADVVNAESAMFVGNSATRNGGGLMCGDLSGGSQDVVALSSCVFSNNSALWGGNVFAIGLASLQVQRGSVSGGRAEEQGGGMYVGSVTEVLMEGGALSRNEAVHGDGGAVYADALGSFVVRNVLVGQNKAASGAGVMLTTALTCVVEGARFVDNDAKGDGAGIYVGRATRDVTVTGCNMTGNTASMGSGAVVVASATNVTVQSCSFAANFAETGADVAIEATRVVIADSSFRSSASAGSGGCVSVISTGSLTLSTLKFSGCVSKSTGGGVYAAGTSSLAVVLESSSFDGCVAPLGAGAAVVAGSLVVSACSFRNGSGAEGGAIHARVQAVAEVAGSSFLGNGAVLNGSALWLSGNSSLTNCSFVENFGSATIVLNGPSAELSHLDASGGTGGSSVVLAEVSRLVAARFDFASNQGAGIDVGTYADTATVVSVSHGKLVGTASADNTYGYSGGLVMRTCPSRLDWDDVRVSSASSCAVAVYLLWPTPEGCPDTRRVCDDVIQPAGQRCAHPAAALVVTNHTASVRSGDAVQVEYVLVDGAGNIVPSDPLFSPSQPPALRLFLTSASSSASATSNVTSTSASVADMALYGAPTLLHAQCGVYRLSAGILDATTTPLSASLLVSLPSTSRTRTLTASANISVLPCGAGHVLHTLYHTCLLCPPGTYSLVQVPSASSTCAGCPPHSTCPGGSAVTAADGYYLSLPSSSSPDSVHLQSSGAEFMRVQQCPVVGSCVNGTCAQGYAGTLCGECASGYGKTFRNTCVRCSSGFEGPLAAVVVTLLLALLVWTLGVATARPEGSRETNPAGGIKPGMVAVTAMYYLQWGSLARALHLPWAGPSLSILGVPLSVLTAVSNPSLIPSWKCIFGLDAAQDAFFLRVVLLVLSPVFFAMATVILFMCGRVIAALARRRRTRRPTSFVSVAAIATWILLPYIYLGIFQMFACIEVADGTLRLYAQLDVDCSSSSYRQWLYQLALPALIVYCALLPALLLLLLLHGAREDRLADSKLRDKYGFLYCNFSSRLPWMAVLYLLHIMVLALTAAGLNSSPVGQGLAFQTLLVVPAFLVSRTDPLRHPLLTSLTVASTAVLMVSVSVGMYASLEASSAVTVTALAALAVVLHIVLCFSLAAVAFLASKSKIASRSREFFHTFKHKSSIRELKIPQASGSQLRAQDEELTTPISKDELPWQATMTERRRNSTVEISVPL